LFESSMRMNEHSTPRATVNVVTDSSDVSKPSMERQQRRSAPGLTVHRAREHHAAPPLRALRCGASTYEDAPQDL